MTIAILAFLIMSVLVSVASARFEPNFDLKKIGPREGSAGIEYYYSLSYYNNGGAASNVKLVDTLPPGVEPLLYDNGIYSSGTVTWDIGTVGAFASGGKNIKFKIKDGTAVGTITNKASISTTSTSQVATASYQTNVIGKPTNIYYKTELPIEYSDCSQLAPSNPPSIKIDIENENLTPPLEKKTYTVYDGKMIYNASKSQKNNKPTFEFKVTFYPYWGKAFWTITPPATTPCKISSDSILVDPAGYIYDIDNPDQRIAGATVWLQYRTPAGFWDYVPTGEGRINPDENPQTTGKYGQYQWDVQPNVSYQVYVEAPEYYPNYSIDYYVTEDFQPRDVNVPLEHVPVFNISGFKINDANGNGVLDAGEKGIRGWKIVLRNSTTGAEKANTTTNADGLYEFMDLVNGSYNVSEELKSGWIPTNSTFNLVTINGQDIMNLNFLNQPVTPSISGYKINDTNGNGKWDVGEAGLSGWKIKLKGVGVENRHVNEETFTDATGFYNFYNLTPGLYLVSEKTMKSFVPTSSPAKVILVAKSENSVNNNFMNVPIHSLIRKHGESYISDENEEEED